MSKDLTNSLIDRQNILNNQYALKFAEKHLAFGGIEYKGETVFTKEHIKILFDISESTVEKYISTWSDEFKANGYTVLRGHELSVFKDLASGTGINYGTKTTVLGLFKFRTVLNFAMVLTESENARLVRKRLLDIVMDVVAQKAGGHTKYINQRDQHYLSASYREFSYRKVFTDALKQYLDMGDIKYPIYTDKIYQLVFKENAKEYKKILNLLGKENLRETLYSEVLLSITSIESGLAEQMKNLSEKLNRKITPQELNSLIAEAEKSPFLKPMIEDSRMKMASRDLCFRDILHNKLEEYIHSVPGADFEKFLGETSKSLEERLSDPETLKVFKRLKDR